MDVFFNKRTQYASVGRNGAIITTGVAIESYGSDVSLTPINSRGGITGSCYVSISKESIPEVIRVLDQLYRTP